MFLFVALLFAVFSTFGVSSALPTPAWPAAEYEYAPTEWLVDGEWLRTALAADNHVKVVALTSGDEFAMGHVPGAAQIDWPALEIVETSDQNVSAWRSDVELTLTELGLSPTDTVVIYDGGTLYAPRLWWILDQLEHPDKRILNGGLKSWTEAGGDVATGASTAEPAIAPYAGQPNESAIATIDEVQDALDDPSVVLVDARTPSEYAAGHIPGAINIEFTMNAKSDGSGVWKSSLELLAIYATAGVTPEKQVIPYCTTGVRSAATYFTLRLIGYEHVMLFTGSFKEWSADPSRPVD